MNRTVTRVAALAAGATAVLATSALLAPHAEAAGKSLHGCPSGAVCIYPTKGGLKAGPERGEIFYSYGAHNLTNQYGKHVIVNNQYQGAGFRVCYSYGGRNCTGIDRFRGVYYPFDLAKVDSFTLVR